MEKCAGLLFAETELFPGNSGKSVFMEIHFSYSVFNPPAEMIPSSFWPFLQNGQSWKPKEE